MKSVRINNFFHLPVLAVVSNQVDKKTRAISKEEASEFAASIGALYFETSAKLNQGFSFEMI
jgi:hypothetical protein